MRIGLAEAKARLPAVVDRVFHHSERYVIERRGRPVAALVGVEELARLEATSPAGERPLGALALVGAWAELDDAEIDAFLANVRAARDADTGRPVSVES